eukprot:6826836-Pyramimonas_sp.AAC.1
MADRTAQACRCQPRTRQKKQLGRLESAAAFALVQLKASCFPMLLLPKSHDVLYLPRGVGVTFLEESKGR